MNDHKTSTPTLVSALRILAGEIQSDDGVANMTIAEAADRIEELVEYYGEALALERNRAERAEQRNAELVAALEFWRDLRNESKGLAYYHLNGEVAYWGEFDDPTDKALARAESAAHAKHPDTELLEWLFGNTIIAGPDGHVIECRDDANAARKHGGAK